MRNNSIYRISFYPPYYLLQQAYFSNIDIHFEYNNYSNGNILYKTRLLSRMYSIYKKM